MKPFLQALISLVIGATLGFVITNKRNPRQLYQAHQRGKREGQKENQKLITTLSKRIVKLEQDQRKLVSIDGEKSE